MNDIQRKIPPSHQRRYRNREERIWFCTNCQTDQPRDGFVQVNKWRSHCVNCERRRRMRKDSVL